MILIHLFFIFSGVCLEQNLLTNKRNLSFDEECSSQENVSGKKKDFFYISKDIWSNFLFLDEIVKMLNITTLRWPEYEFFISF